MEATRAVARKARQRSLHHGYLVVALSLLTGTAAIGLARLAYSVILPAMKESLALDFAQTGQIATGNFVGYLLMALAGGALAVRFGPRVVIAASALVGGLALVLTGLAGDFWLAFFARFLTGIGSGGMNVPGVALLAAWFAPTRRGLVSGIAVTGTSLGLIVSGLFLPGIISGATLPVPAGSGWRWAWFALGAFVLLTAALGALFLRNRPEELGLAPIGAPAKPLAHVRSLDKGLAWTHVYRLPALWHLGLIYCCYGFSYIIYFTYFVAHLRDRGLPIEEAGAMWGWLGWISLPGAFVWGWISDVIGRKYALAAVFTFVGLTCLVFALAGSTPWYIASLLLFGACGWSIPGIMGAASGDYVPARLVPAALGFLTVIFGVGQAVAPWIAGTLRDASGSFTSSFYVAAAVALAGSACALLLRPAR